MQKILVAYDGGEPAKRAITAAAELSRAFGAEVSVISVVPRRMGRSPTDPWDDHTVHAEELLEAQRLLRERGIEPLMLEPSGNPASEIERIAEAGEYDTVVVGSRSLNALGRLLEGSVSEHVATHARQTVVIAR